MNSGLEMHPAAHTKHHNAALPRFADGGGNKERRWNHNLIL
jgi:hypothetical protein